ncbi:uncharacterized protein LOC141726325 isoform X4 [Zonotrichia albicollis]|uniref:uncharacterized protein LOC141726325 isoform X4 n=1 Tax=Zonotrichia albicollis TaxID=44394 RepID=UPI003D80FC2C
MTGVPGGGDSAAPPEETPRGSPSPSPAGSPRCRRPSPHSSAPPGRGPPFWGGVSAPAGDPGHRHRPPARNGRGPQPRPPAPVGGALQGHAHPAWDHALPFPHLRLSAGGAQLSLSRGAAGGPRGGLLSLARLELQEELPGAEPERIQVLRFPTPPAAGPAPAQPVLRLRWGPPRPRPPRSSAPAQGPAPPAGAGAAAEPPPGRAGPGAARAPRPRPPGPAGPRPPRHRHAHRAGHAPR